MKKLGALLLLVILLSSCSTRVSPVGAWLGSFSNASGANASLRIDIRSVSSGYRADIYFGGSSFYAPCSWDGREFFCGILESYEVLTFRGGMDSVSWQGRWEYVGSGSILGGQFNLARR
jgi:hypothetical protein